MNKNIEILKNPICKFQILNNEHLIKKDKKINVFCSIFFKIKKNYKDFSEYINGLKHIMNYIDNLESKFDYKYLLFVDHHIMNDNEIMKIIYASKKTIPVLFTCSDYMKDNYHLDLFGFIVRYIPFFNFENNFTNRVIVIDIELDKNSLNSLKSMKDLKFDYTLFSGSKFWDRIYKNTDDILLVGCLISITKKYDKKIFLDLIKNADKIKTNLVYKMRKSTWGYGIDEIFLNEIFKKKIEYSIIKDYHIGQIFYRSRKYLFDKSRIKNSYKILKQIIDKVREVDFSIISDNPTLKDMISLIDKYTFRNKQKTKINDIISINFYKAINNALKTNTEFLERNKMIFISKYLNNVISCKFVVTINKNQNIKVVDLYDVIYNSAK